MKVLQGQPKGQILLVAAAILFFGIFLATLAVDAGRAYGVKAKLHAAVDAASFEAAKALAQCSGPELEMSERVSGIRCAR